MKWVEKIKIDAGPVGRGGGGGVPTRRHFLKDRSNCLLCLIRLVAKTTHLVQIKVLRFVSNCSSLLRSRPPHILVTNL